VTCDEAKRWAELILDADFPREILLRRIANCLEEAAQQAATHCVDIIQAQIERTRQYGGATGCAELARNTIMREFGLVAESA
jgi:hypothetical protein